MVELEDTMTHTTTHPADEQLTPFEQKLATYHPRLTHLPDYGVALHPQTDARLRGIAEAGGMDYDLIKREFCLCHQVIPAREDPALSPEVDSEYAIPLDRLPAYFEGYVQSAVRSTLGRQRLRVTLGGEGILPFGELK